MLWQDQSLCHQVDRGQSTDEGQDGSGLGTSAAVFLTYYRSTRYGKVSKTLAGSSDADTGGENIGGSRGTVPESLYMELPPQIVESKQHVELVNLRETVF
jgi:hypothetical protein